MTPTLIRRCLMIGLLSAVAATSAQAQQGQIAKSDGGSDAIARFVMNFGRFIDWPDAAFASADGDLRVCVLGENELGNSLNQIVNGKRAGDRTIAVSNLAGSDVAAARDCHIVYVSSSETGRTAEITGAVAGSHALTVSEIVNFPEDGGMIGLSGERGDRIAIRMNRALIEQTGLNVREQLMRAIQ
ncbi:MAG: YfiR family protein [Pseudohongiella sp.]